MPGTAPTMPLEGWTHDLWPGARGLPHPGARGGGRPPPTTLWGLGVKDPPSPEPASYLSPTLFQGEKGEPGPVFSRDGSMLAPGQKGAKVSWVPETTHLQSGRGGALPGAVEGPGRGQFLPPHESCS